MNIQKTHQKSFIVRGQHKDIIVRKMMDDLFMDGNPKYNDRKVVVLQVAEDSKGYIYIEAVYQSDYDNGK